MVGKEPKRDYISFCFCFVFYSNSSAKAPCQHKPIRDLPTWNTSLLYEEGKLFKGKLEMQKPPHRNHHSVDPSGIFKVFYLDMGGFDNYLLKIPFWGRRRICKIGHENQMAIRIFKAVVPKMLNSRGNMLYSCSFLIHIILNDSFLKLVCSFSLSENNTFGRNVLKTLVK